ncbi:MAG: peptidase E [Myxococcales bacterium]|nr:peptidase E [Myxococcales bacterium]MCB9580147.1 peptidase E [Polyangiaceae bacterium]
MGHIVALGGGGFSMEDSPLLDDYILSLGRQPRPRICFLGTASGDNENYVVRFYRRFSRADCRPTHLELFRRAEQDLEGFAKEQDIFYVGGGNTANMLAVWRLHGFERALKAAYAEGTVLAGVSAGAVCWFEQGVTDSFGRDLSGMEGLGMLSGSFCPHYDGEPLRRPRYHELVAAGMPAGIAADDSVAVHYEEGVVARAVGSRKEARAFYVRQDADRVVEEPLGVQYLG